MHVPFGLLFAKYMRSNGVPPISGLLLSNRKRIGLSETPEGMGFDTGYHVIIFVNLLIFFNPHDLEYQDDYPLTGRNKREGVLNEHTMTVGRSKIASESGTMDRQSLGVSRIVRRRRERPKQRRGE